MRRHKPHHLLTVAGADKRETISVSLVLSHLLALESPLSEKPYRRVMADTTNRGNYRLAGLGVGMQHHDCVISFLSFFERRHHQVVKAVFKGAETSPKFIPARRLPFASRMYRTTVASVLATVTVGISSSSINA